MYIKPRVQDFATGKNFAFKVAEHSFAGGQR